MTEKYLSPLVSCLTCREVKSAKGLFTHFLSMHTTKENHDKIAGGKHRKIKIITKSQTESRIKRKQYELKPEICICGKPKSYKIRKNKYCSQSCAAKYTNIDRGSRTAETKLKQSKSATGKYRGNISKSKIKFEDLIVGPYTKIYLCTCKFSNTKFYSKTVKQIYPDLRNTYDDYSRACTFKFGISDYPEWFINASELISKYGWYASSSKTHPGINNPNGISRDHRISVNYGFKNDVDPKIIAHPANCKLMQHKHNSSKGKNIELSLDELLLEIAKFEIAFK